MTSTPSVIDRELVERMVACLRTGVAHADKVGATWDKEGPALVEARAILALLPEPVDPDLIEARAIVAAEHSDPCYGAWVSEVLEGIRDNTRDVCMSLAGIKRGRELAEQKGA